MLIWQWDCCLCGLKFFLDGYVESDPVACPYCRSGDIVEIKGFEVVDG